MPVLTSLGLSSVRGAEVSWCHQLGDISVYACCYKFAQKIHFLGESHVNPMEFNVTVHPPSRWIEKDRGPDNLFDGDVLEFDHSIFEGADKPNRFPTTESTPQK